MYYIQKRLEISAAHKLELPYESKCSNLHGHNWIVTIYCRADVLTKYGMIVDFAKVKKHIQDKLDHKYINEVLDGINPTAENMAKWICDEVTRLCEQGICYMVNVQESEGNVATYEVTE